MEGVLKKKKLRGLTTAWWESGPEDAPIMLLLHGYPDTPQAWELQIQHFKDRYRVVTPYVRGAGASQVASDIQRYSPDSIALDILEILRTCDPDGQSPVVCVGHDFGALYAWEVAQLIPNQLHALVVINGVSVHQVLKRLKFPRQHLKSWYVYALQVPVLPELILSRVPEAFLRFAYRQGGLPASMQPQTGKASQAVVAPINQYRALARALPKMAKRAPNKIRAPVLVVWGDHDKFLLTPTMEELEPFADNVVVRILEGNHWIHREKAAEVNSILDEFLQKKELL